MANFKIAYLRTARFEGGYTDDPDDNGNWTGGAKGVGHLVGTNFGITAPDMAVFLKRIPTVGDLKNMLPSTAECIYKHRYWDPMHGDDIIDQDIANNIYDSAVNMGVGTAIILAQRGLGLLETGKMDSNTLNALNK